MRATVRSLLELLALCGLAVAQPVLDVFGRAPEVFIFQGASSADIVWFGILVTLVPALVLWLAELALGLVSRPAARWFHLVALGGLAGLVVLQALKRADWAGGLLLAAIAVAAAVGAAALYRRFGLVRQWLAVMAFAPALFLAFFLVSSPTSELLSQGGVEAADIGGQGAARSVVFVIWDEFPVEAIVNGEGEIDRQLFPNLARLAAGGAWYRNATTVASQTSIAVPSLLTGRFPEGGLLPVASDHPENLFTLLASRYDLEVFEQVTALCPSELCDDPTVDGPGAADEQPEPTEPSPGGLRELLADARTSYRTMISLDDDAQGPRQFVEYTTEVSAPAPGGDAVDVARGDEAVPGLPPVLEIEAFDQLLRSIERDEDPALHFLHLQLPHGPYRFLPSGRAYQDIDADGGLLTPTEARSDEQYEADLSRQRLILQVGYVDRLVGRLLDRLDATGMTDETIVVMSSDHGIGLEPGYEQRPVFGTEPVPEELFADLLYVPLIIAGPGIEPGTVSDENVMTVDVVPTVADLLGVELPWEVDGVALTGAGRTSAEKRFNKVLVEASGGLGGGNDLAPTQHFDGDEFLARMLERNVDSLLRGENPDHRVFDITDGGELVGEPVSGLDEAGRAGGLADLDDLGALEDYQEGAAFVPVRLKGDVEGGDRTVAVAVDGVIVAVVPTFGDGELDAMLDPSLVAPGRHEVALYEVTGPAGARRLAEIPLS
jgi:hypothetical protein